MPSMYLLMNLYEAFAFDFYVTFYVLQEAYLHKTLPTMAPRKANPMLNATVEFVHNKQGIGRGKVLKVINLDVLHGTRLPKGCYGVAVISVYGGKDAPLPHLVPMEDNIKTLKEAINTTIAWPKEDLVYFLF